MESETAGLTGETASEVVGGTSSETELLLRFARVGQDAGYATAELEERALALARTTGLEDVQISVTPRVIDVSVGALPSQRSYTLRVRVRLGPISHQGSPHLR